MIMKQLINNWPYAVSDTLHASDNGKRHFEFVWLHQDDNLNTICALLHILSFESFCLNFQI